MVSLRAEQAADTNALITSASVEALAIITCPNDTIPSAIFLNNIGIKLRIASPITKIDLANRLELAAIVVIPTDNASKPTPMAPKPSPMYNITFPNSFKVSILGSKAYTATPNITNTPAMKSRAFPISDKAIPPNFFNTIANANNAGASSNNDFAPSLESSNFLRETTNINIDPAKANKPLASCSQDNLLIDLTAAPIIINAAPIPIKDAVFPLISSGMNFKVNTIKANDPANTVIPLAISSQDNLAICLIAIANRFNAIPNAIRVAPILGISFFSLSNNRVTIITSANITVRPSNPFANSSQVNFANCLTDWTRTNIATENTIKPLAVLFNCSDIFSPPNSLETRTSIVDSAPIPITPFATPSQSRPANVFIANESIRIDVEKAINIVTIFGILVLPMDRLRIIIVLDNSTNNIDSAIIESSNFSPSINDKTNNDAAKIAIAEAIVNNVLAFKFC